MYTFRFPDFLIKTETNYLIAICLNFVWVLLFEMDVYLIVYLQ